MKWKSMRVCRIFKKALALFSSDSPLAEEHAVCALRLNIDL